MYTIWAFDGMKSKYHVYRGIDYMKKFCESLKEHAIKIINLEKRKIISLTNKNQESYENTKIWYIFKKVWTYIY